MLFRSLTLTVVDKNANIIFRDNTSIAGLEIVGNIIELSTEN